MRTIAESCRLRRSAAFSFDSVVRGVGFRPVGEGFLAPFRSPERRSATATPRSREPGLNEDFFLISDRPGKDKCVMLLVTKDYLNTHLD
jgi:hypothetical protein